MSLSALSDHQRFMAVAVGEAAKSLAEQGIPVGAVLVRQNQIIGAGRNQRVQKADPILHGEMDCMRNAGRQKSYADVILYTTLSPCMMCSGAIVQFGIPIVAIGENKTFGGNEEFLRARGVEVIVLDDPECKRLMDAFIRKYPEVWSEDIGGKNVRAQAAASANDRAEEGSHRRP